MNRPSFTRRALVSALAGVALTASLGVLAQGFQVHYRVAGIVPASEPVPETSFTSHTFTNCGQTGRFGPSLAQCQSAYSGAEVLNDEYAFNVLSGIQLWRVPVDGKYRIVATGASGGGPYQYQAGKGAEMEGEFNLRKGDQLRILVGQQGSDTTNTNSGSGGGGGSYVTDRSNVPLIVAGGGGGAGRNGNYTHGHGGDAPTTNIGTNAGETSGHYGGGNGAGFLGDGESAKALINGGHGGVRYWTYGGDGGFGGGAGNSGHLGGGGSGYNGGIGGTLGTNGALNGVIPTGGGSYNAGTNQSNQSGANSGHGRVTIILLSQ